MTSTPTPAGASADPAAPGRMSPEQIATMLAGAAQRLAPEANGQRAYAGDVTPTEAWVLAGQPGVHLIDVRSREEHRYVGRVPDSRLVVWRGTSEDQVAQFLNELRAEANPQEVVLLLCRSGVRSVRAATAATAHGFQKAFNILEGFEGRIDANEQRGHIDGWRKAGLPWKQD